MTARVEAQDLRGGRRTPRGSEQANSQRRFAPITMTDREWSRCGDLADHDGRNAHPPSATRIPSPFRPRPVRVQSDAMGRRAEKNEPEVFRFALDGWTLDCSLHLEDRPRAPLGLCWGSETFCVAGALRSATRRKVSRVELRIYPMDEKPEEWKSEWKAIGAVHSIRHGTLEAHVRLPAHAFHTLLLGMVAGKVRGMEFTARRTGSRLEFIRSFYTVDPEQPD